MTKRNRGCNGRMQYAALNPKYVDRLNKFIADPDNPTSTEIAALAADDPKTANGKPIYNGWYNAAEIFGRRLNHAQVLRQISDGSRIVQSRADTLDLNNPAVLDKWWPDG
ncbi:hypothetical protein N657DRAFT_694363 [Parathielavia appendiculata]|uniref:Uncharacterized protein n=1 Tax=Parathielavia appendiculata TaxID=2587402 RepID=A0AAN6YY69_9PEZI|nr:hypothetical protein N657DRAFT_694363 [Parathielavia appendiculata]